MTQTEYNVVRKALVKAGQLRLGIDETMNLIQMYEDLANDLVGDGPAIVAPPASVLGGGLQYRQPDPPPVVEQYSLTATDASAKDHVFTNKPVRSLSATSALSVEPEGPEESVDDIFEKIRAEVPARLEVLAPGYTKPMVFHVDPYKSDQQGVAGLTFSKWGDRSQIFSRTAYSPGKPYDAAKDISEFVESQQQIFKARQQPVRNNAPAPMPFPTNFDNNPLIEKAGHIVYDGTSR